MLEMRLENIYINFFQKLKMLILEDVKELKMEI